MDLSIIKAIELVPTPRYIPTMKILLALAPNLGWKESEIKLNTIGEQADKKKLWNILGTRITQ